MRLSNYDIHIFDTIYFILKCSETKEKRELDRKAGLGHVNRTFGHVSVESQEPHSQILIMEGGGVQQRFIFYTQKRSQLQYLSTQKNHYFFEHTQKNILVLFLQPKKIPPFFSRPQKIMASFIDPKKSPLAKISDPKNHSEPPVIKVCEWGPWGVKKY